MRYLIALGLVLLLIGSALPATQTVMSESCTDGFSTGEFGERVGGGCVEATTQVPNTNRQIVLTVGFMFLLVGGIRYFIDPKEILYNYHEGKRDRVETTGRVETSTTTKNAQHSSGDGTKIRVSAETKNRESDKTSITKLTMETTDVGEAKDTFIQHCEKQNLWLVSDIETEIVD